MAEPRKFPVQVCSCGAGVDSCPIWGPIHNKRHALASLDTAARYRLLMDCIAEAKSDTVNIVDSSKTLDVLRMLYREFRDNVRVIFLVKDIRNYLHSALKRAGTFPGAAMVPKKSTGRWRSWLARIVPTFLLYSWRWRRVNLLMQNFLIHSGTPHFRLGYEEFMLKAVETLPSLESFLGVEKKDALSHAGHHILLGNFPYLSGSKQLRYDEAWLHSERLTFPVAMVAATMTNVNRRLVYGEPKR